MTDDSVVRTPEYTAWLFLQLAEYRQASNADVGRFLKALFPFMKDSEMPLLVAKVMQLDAANGGPLAELKRRRTEHATV